VIHGGGKPDEEDKKTSALDQAGENSL